MKDSSLSLFSSVLQANLAVQQSRLTIANVDLQKAQAELDAKQAELDVVQAEYEKAMMEKQVSSVPYFPRQNTSEDIQFDIYSSRQAL